MKKFALLLFSIMLVAMTACRDDNPSTGNDHKNPTYKGLNLFPSVLSAIADGQNETSVKIQSEKSWTATVDKDWCSVVPSSGSAGETQVTISVKANDTYEERNTSITFTSNGITKTVTLTQKQQNAILLSSSKVEVSAEGGSFALEAKANVTFTVTYESEGDWLHESSKSRGLTASEISYTVDPNPSADSRVGKIHFKSETLSETVEVYQSGSEPELVLTQSEYVIPAEGDTLTVELATNSRYSYKMPDVDWIVEPESRSLSTYTHRFIVKENTEDEQREAQIVFINENSGDEYSVKVTQLPLAALVLAKNEYRFDSKEQEWELQLLASVAFDAVSDAEWLNVVESDGRSLDPKRILLNLQRNVSAEARHATLTVSGDDGTVQSIKVTQTGEHDLMRLTLIHEEASLLLPCWAGQNVFGSVNWGDDTVQELMEGLFHDYKTSGTHTMTVDLYNAETITIEKIGSISAITIYTNQGKKGSVEDMDVNFKEWD